MLNYTLLVTGPAYGTEHSFSALQFAKTVLSEGHQLKSVFFYREGVTNANQLTTPASDEYDIVRAWQKLAREHGVILNVCIAAALRRGIIDSEEAKLHQKTASNLQEGFVLGGLGLLAESMLTSDRLVQF